MISEKWIKPLSIDELKEVLKEKKPSDAFISGGTDFLVSVRKGKTYDKLIDLTGIEEFKKVRIEGEYLSIGGELTYDEIVNNQLINDNFPVLVAAARTVGSQQIRNRGTIAGGLASASPACDAAPLLTALKADIKLMDQNGNLARMPVNEFLIGAGKTKLCEKECIAGFEIPIGRWQKTAFIKLGRRREMSIAQLTAAIALSLDNDLIKECSLVLGSAGVKPVTLPESEAVFIGKNFSDLTKKDFKTAAEFFSHYLIKNAHRKYKSIAVFGVFEDLFEKLHKL